MLDKGHLDRLKIYTCLLTRDLHLLLRHIQQHWDDGAARTAFMYFKGYPMKWVNFIEHYFYSLEDYPFGGCPLPLKNYSAYAVYLARLEGPMY